MVDLRRVDLNLLVVLDALLAECNVTRAAQRLHMSQPATSTALARLRKQLEDPILVKDGRSLRPTPRALALVEPLRSVLATVERSILSPPDFDPARDSRVFTVLAGDYAEVALLRVLMKSDRYRTTAVQFDLRPVTGRSLAAFHRHDVDLAILPDHLLEQPQFDRCGRALVLTDRFVGAVWTAHPHRGTELTPEVLARYPLLSYAAHDGSSQIDRSLARVGVYARVGATTANVAVMPYALEETHLVTLIPARLASRLVGSADIRILEPTFPLAPVRQYAVWHEVHESDPAHTWLRGQIMEMSARVARVG
ncbi:LysR family transcriptional regulator [Rhodococcus sp. CX]|uniref:LysR family transcriptional regulator n=1 Tax=Rhodococcus sp. CX TaxID=2789880 RepID=UPI001E41EF04|nr:LysR family transcriptional regulator [Rhodococcus sp. CX]